MNKYETIIDNFLKHYYHVRSETSFSYLVYYFMQRGMANYLNTLEQMIFNSKQPEVRFISTMHSLYSHSIVNNEFSSFESLLNLNGLFYQLKDEQINIISNEIDSYLRGGVDLADIESKLYEIFQTSSLYDFWKKSQTH